MHIPTGARVFKYIEFGFGNDSFVSSEVEWTHPVTGQEQEYRIKGIVPYDHTRSLYVRLWVWKTVFIVSTRPEWKVTRKTKPRFKLIFGLCCE